MSNRSLVTVPLEQLVADPDQPRREFSPEALQGLGATLAAGQVHPIVAYRDGERLRVLDGERRLRAARQAGLTSVEVMIVEPPKSDADRLRQQLVTSIHREELRPVEKARAIQALMRCSGATAAEVAAQLALSSATVSRLLALLALPESDQQRVDSGELPASTAYEIAKVRDHEARSALVSEVVRGERTRDEVAAQVRGKRPRSRRPRRSPNCIAKRIRLGEGCTLAVACGRVTVETLISQLERALKALMASRSSGASVVEVLGQVAPARTNKEVAK